MYKTRYEKNESNHILLQYRFYNKLVRELCINWLVLRKQPQYYKNQQPRLQISCTNKIEILKVIKTSLPTTEQTQDAFIRNAYFY